MNQSLIGIYGDIGYVVIKGYIDKCGVILSYAAMKYLMSIIDVGLTLFFFNNELDNYVKSVKVRQLF